MATVVSPCRKAASPAALAASRWTVQSLLLVSSGCLSFVSLDGEDVAAVLSVDMVAALSESQIEWKRATSTSIGREMIGFGFCDQCWIEKR